MVVFKDHKIGANHLLRVIPESLLANLSATTKVDHYSKVLHGNTLLVLTYDWSTLQCDGQIPAALIFG